METAEQARAERAEADTAREVASRPTPPALGAYWPGQGGIYRGLARADGDLPEGHLIQAAVQPPKRANNSTQIAWAEGLEIDGHKDFQLVSTDEAAIVRANTAPEERLKEWTWTRTQYVSNTAWFQDSIGSQDISGKAAEGGAVAVRRLVL